MEILCAYVDRRTTSGDLDRGPGDFDACTDDGFLAPLVSFHNSYECSLHTRYSRAERNSRNVRRESVIPRPIFSYSIKGEGMHGPSRGNC